MQLLSAVYFFVFFFIGFSQCSPFFKDIDYKLYDHDNGIAVDSIFEIVPEHTPEKVRKSIRVSQKHRRHV
ncbi:unnamed protein product [Caenorhabditis brenneri]